MPKLLNEPKKGLETKFQNHFEWNLISVQIIFLKLTTFNLVI